MIIPSCLASQARSQPSLPLQTIGEVPESALVQYGKMIQTAQAPPEKDKSIIVRSLEHLVKIASEIDGPVLRYDLPKQGISQQAMFFTVDGGRYYVYQASLVKVKTAEGASLPMQSEALQLSSSLVPEESLKTQPTLAAKLSNQKVLYNIWFLRSLCMIASIMICSLLLAYSFIFVQTYLLSANTTSYFPWSWGVVYTNPSEVMNLFTFGIGISLAGLVVASNLLLVFLVFVRRGARDSVA